MHRLIVTGIVAMFATTVITVVVALYGYIIQFVFGFIGNYGAICLTLFIVLWALAWYDYNEE